MQCMSMGALLNLFPIGDDEDGAELTDSLSGMLRWNGFHINLHMFRLCGFL